MHNLALLKGGAESIISGHRAAHICTSGVRKQINFSPAQLKLVNKPMLEIGNSYASCVYYGHPIKETNQNELLDIFTKKILKDIKSVQNNFSDLRNRQILFYHFKENIDNIWDFVSEDDFSENLVMVLTNCIKNLNAEDIKYDQLDAIKEVIETISRGNITEEKLDFYIEFLIEKDIPLVRFPGNISDLYD